MYNSIFKDKILNFFKRYISVATFCLAVIIYISTFQLMLNFLTLSEKSPSYWKEWQNNFLNNKISLPAIETEDNIYKYKFNFDELRKYNEFNTDFAYSHLMRFGTKVHSYNTDEIKDVESYILSYTEALQELSMKLYEKNIVEVDFDRRTSTLAEKTLSKITSRSGFHTTYFESSNILVRVHPLSFTLPNNKNSNNTIKSYGKPALLLSAHHDSQSTSHGASDDGISVVSLLESLRLSILNPPKTVDLIYHFNSGEEKGMLGSKAFLLHEWKNDVKGFINMEASGIGNRGMIFQSSSNIINKAFSKTPHPHSSVIAFTGFKLRVVNSNTDFQIYNAANIPGVDFAIYSNRAFYHTYKDDASNMHFESLKVFGETVCSAISTLGKSNEIDKLGDSEDGGVFFDVLGYFSEVYSFKSYIIICSIVATLQFISIVLIIIKTVYLNLNKNENNLSLTIRFTFLPILRGLIAIIVGILFYVALAVASNYFWVSGEGMAAHSKSDYVFGSYTFLGLVCLSVAIYLWSWYENGRQLDLIEPILIQSSGIFWLVCNILNIVLLTKGLGPLYFLSILSIFNFIYSTIHGLLFKYNYPSLSINNYKKCAMNLSDNSSNDDISNGRVSNDVASNDIIYSSNKYNRYVDVFNNLLLFLIIILSNLFFQEIVIAVLAGLTQTIPTGGKKTVVYYFISSLGGVSTLISINLIPKVIKRIPIKMMITFLVIWIIISISVFFSFPVNEKAPLVFQIGQNKCISEEIGCNLMRENIDPFSFDSNDNSYGSITSTSYLKEIINSIPSAKDNPLSSIKPIGDQYVYHYSAPEPIFPIENYKLINATLKKGTSDNNDLKLRVQLNAYRSNICLLSFYKQDVTNIAIKTINSKNKNERLVIDSYNQNEIVLMRRDYNFPFEVSFDYLKNNTFPAIIKLGISCFYDDPKFIPAVQEINEHMPRWSTVSTTRVGVLYLFKDFVFEL